MISEAQHSTFKFLMAISVISMILGLSGMGCNSAWCHKFLVLSICFGVILFTMWTALFVVGVGLVSVSESTPRLIESFCNYEPMSSSVDFLIDHIQVIDTEVHDYSTHYMCSAYCPCQPEQATRWINLPEATLNYFQRTKRPGEGVTDAAGNFRIVTANSGQTFSTFQSCHEHLSGTLGVKNRTVLETPLKIVSYFEQTYGCSGVCQPALFFYETDLDSGMPESTCLEPFRNSIHASMGYLGITCIVMASLMFWIWVFQYCLWKPQTVKD